MNAFSFTQQGIKIGATIDTKPLYYVPVRDIDASIIQVPYRNSEITIGSLIENYEEITNCKQIAKVEGQEKERVYFLILQGYYKGNIAKDQFELSSMDLSFDKPCLQVVDNVDKESIQVTESKLMASQQSSMVRLKVKYNQDTFEVVINCNQRVISLKNQLKQRLQLPSVDMIQINFRNIILLNINKISHYKGLVNDSEIAVVLCCRTHNCFRKGTMITTAKHGQIAIEKLQKGTKVICFDTNEGSFVEDEVAMTKKQIVSEEINITLEDETVIEATPNHLFLCSDQRYRKYQFEINSEPLKVGDRFMQINKKESSIKSLGFKQIDPAQQFYYFFLKKGNNFIANKIIAYNARGHNISVHIDYGKIHGDQISFRSDQLIKNIKKALQMRYQQHHAACMKIICSARQCVDSAILSDYATGKEAKLLVVIKERSDYTYLHSETEVIFEVNKKRKIKDILMQEDRKKIQLQNEKCFFLSSQPQKKKITEYYKITFEEGQEIFVSHDTFLEMENGEVKISHELFELYSKGLIGTQNDLFLKKYNGHKIKIIKISRISKNQGQYFYRLPIQQQNDIIISPSITIYNSVIFLSFNQNTIAFGINKKTTIIEIKQKLSVLYKQHVRTLHFYFNNKQLINQTTFQQKQIQIGELVQVTTSNVTQSMILQPQKSKDVQFEIQLKITDSQIYKIQYEKFKKKTVQQIMKYLIPSYKSSFFFLYQRLIILPTETLEKIQNEHQLKDSKEVTVTVIRNQKLSFVMNMNLKGSEIHNISFIVTERYSQISLISIDQENRVEKVESSNQYREAQQRIKNSNMADFYKQECFYRPVLYFFDPDFRQEMRQYMKNFSLHLQQQQGGHVFKMIKSLYINLIYLPNHITKLITQTYFGVRNFKFNSHFKKNDTFYLYEYLLTSNDEESVRCELNNHHGTLFRLTSLTGKRVNNFSVNPPHMVEQTIEGISRNVDYLQLLFPPYTYFLVDKVERHQCFDEVWISQISTPLTLQKDIILWVDDNPRNNIKQMQEILGKDLQILPLISTLQARKWLKQFGWLMNWKGINFKLISDMHRLEYNEHDDEKQSNDIAGFQLIEKIYQENDGDIKACIYCGNKQRTENLLKKDPRFEKIRPKFQEHSFKIQQREPKILEFCNEQ